MKRSLILGGVLGAALFTAGGSAQAQSIIRNNDPHPHFEIDVHGTLATSFFSWGYGGWGVGGGFRVGLPIVPSGFLSRANDSFALSIGADLVFLPYYWSFYTGAELIGHVDAQWNFFLTPRWSVFGELGVAPRFYFSAYNCGGCSIFGSFGDWFDFAAGARYHFRGDAGFPTLTMRMGTAGFTIGVSF